MYKRLGLMFLFGAAGKTVAAHDMKVAGSCLAIVGLCAGVSAARKFFDDREAKQQNSFPSDNSLN